jgi:hypothetical protein
MGPVRFLAIFFGVIFGVIGLSMVASLFSDKQSSPGAVGLAPSPTPSASSASLVSRPSPTPTPSAWQYNEWTESMTGKTTATATLTSTNSFEFGFPYNGAQRATLTLRKHPRHGNDIILSIERGQFMPGIDGVAVLARFDEGKPVRFWAVGPADHGTTTLFIRNYSRFVSALQKAERVQISTTVYQEGDPVFIFYCAGLRGF